MTLVSQTKQRVARVAFVFLLLAVTLLSVAAAAAASPAALPVEPDGGIGN